MLLISTALSRPARSSIPCPIVLFLLLGVASLVALAASSVRLASDALRAALTIARDPTERRRAGEEARRARTEAEQATRADRQRLKHVLLNLLSEATPGRIERLRAMGAQYFAKSLDVARVIDLLRDRLCGHEAATMQGGCIR